VAAVRAAPLQPAMTGGLQSSRRPFSSAVAVGLSDISERRRSAYKLTSTIAANRGIAVAVAASPITSL
jgi:hypothetical protein